jgi:hypothetical protein
VDLTLAVLGETLPATLRGRADCGRRSVNGDPQAAAVAGPEDPDPALQFRRRALRPAGKDLGNDVNCREFAKTPT